MSSKSVESCAWFGRGGRPPSLPAERERDETTCRGSLGAVTVDNLRVPGRALHPDRDAGTGDR